MDDTLKKRLHILSTQNVVLSRAREAYLLKEAERKHFEATLIEAEQGSHAQKVTASQARLRFVEFHRDLAMLENQYEFEKLKYEILDKAYLAEYLSLKINAQEQGRYSNDT